ncbi:hypothetical protein EDEG_03121 [Edhazardia aedis USNM 41457]|uniref:Uncharacterized protein n=1 Tax=Edhazardia aedis (strain USNM 41457) TaxID=1003232 RepID=J8ZRX2_EDHAE|nr:hypothetical protein EDEG_03121 [Edhazardia aedis USNM 41457]|eukprot:EJW02448.1 hypothetical protein EDEG_03121 [Edhazardia aedis USNM 41457]
MFLTIIFIHCYLAINLNENAVSSKCHICFNIDNEYIEIECFVFLCSIIKEKVYLLDLDISRKYFLNSNEEIFLTDEIYTKIVRIFSKLLFIRIKEFNFIKIDRENKDDEGDTMKTEQKNTDLFFSYPIDVKMPETLRNWTYNRFIESLDGSSYIYGKYENVVLNAFFKHKFRIDKEYMVLSIFFKNIQHYIDFKTYQTIQMDIDSKNINIDFENSFLYTDPNRLSAYLKNVIDFCYLHNIEHHSIFLKCSTKNFIVELLINSFQIMLNIKSNQNSEKEQYEFKKHLIKKCMNF